MPDYPRDKAMSIAEIQALSTAQKLRLQDDVMAEIEADDLTPIDAVRWIIALHNAEPGPAGGYVLYDPFQPHIASRGRNPLPRPGYVEIASGGEIRTGDPLLFDSLLSQIKYAVRDQLH